MSDICKEWYSEWKNRFNGNIELWNTDKEKCCKKITGIPLDHAAWRYMHIDGAIERMGGFANFRHYVNHYAEEDYLAHAKLKEENERLKARIKILEDAPWIVKDLLEDQEALHGYSIARGNAEEFLRQCKKLLGEE